MRFVGKLPSKTVCIRTCMRKRGTTDDYIRGASIDTYKGYVRCYCDSGFRYRSGSVATARQTAYLRGPGNSILSFVCMFVYG